jgi:hypothetical protein
MSRERYVIQIRTTNRDKSITFKMKTIIDDEDGFIDEVINHVDWKEKLRLLKHLDLPDKTP